MKIEEGKRFRIGDKRHFRSHLRWHLRVFKRKLRMCEARLIGARRAIKFVENQDSKTLLHLSKELFEEQVKWHREYVDNFKIYAGACPRSTDLDELTPGKERRS